MFAVSHSVSLQMQPAHGPAKVDLKTYEVTTREGKIYVKVPPPVAT